MHSTAFRPLSAAAPRAFASALVAAMAITLGLSCGGSEGGDDAEPTAAPAAVEPQGPVDGPALQATSSRGKFTAEITPVGGPIPTNEPFTVRLVVQDTGNGEPLDDYDAIALDARMPAHDHGMLRDVELSPTGTPGEFLAEGLLFHMIGRWEFHVDVTRGPRMERAQVSTTLAF